MKNAIILAAGKSSHFAPFTYEKPKGIFRVKGQVLIERQIEQLQEAGITEIYVVVGYMKEKFFYLEKKYGIKLIVNNMFDKKGNLYSLYQAREYLSDTYICCADHYFVENPFFDNNYENKSYRACSYIFGRFNEFAIEYSDAEVITDFAVGGNSSMAMVGHAYFNQHFSQTFRQYLEKEIHDFGVANMFWEEFYARHMKSLTLYMKEYERKNILEFENIEDLRQFDSEFLLNVDSDIIKNIMKILHCNPNEITEISVINAGLTNVSFAFTLADKKYVYRHPGGTAGNLVDRKSESYAQNIAGKIGIDESALYMDPQGWKLSYYVEGSKNCDFLNSPKELGVAMDYLRSLHNVKVEASVKEFDNIKEGLKLIDIASLTKGNLRKEFAAEIAGIKALYKALEEDALKWGYKKVLCHNDTYEPNFLCDKNGKIYLIDWEYAGLNYAANDIGCILCRTDYTDEEIATFLQAYFKRKLTYKEERFYQAFIAISGFYWFAWGLYKGSVGDDDSFFFLPAYHNMTRFLEKGLADYGIYVKEGDYK